MATKKDRTQAAAAKAIREARREQKLSQEGFAHEIGLHRTYVGSVERGERNVSLENLTKIADRLGLKLSDLMKRASL